MRKLSIISALAVTAAISFADDYVYQQKEPTPTVSYPAVSASTDLVLSGGWSFTVVPQIDTYFSGRSSMPSNTSELNARKLAGVMIIVR